MSFRAVAAAALGVLGAILASAAVRAEPGTDMAAPATASERAHDRLAELFISLNGSARIPSSPRFAALREPDLRGTRVLVGWLLPGLTADERNLLDELVSVLGRRADGAVPAPLAPFGPKLTVAVGVGEVRDVPLLSVELALPRAAAGKELELALLRAIAELAADQTTTRAALARRYLTPLARAVVEMHPPGSPSAAVRVTKPLRHVIERGDTLSEIAENHGLDLKELLRLNSVDPDRPIQPGEALKLSPGGPPRPKLYVAKPGDTLAKVARHFGVSEKALLEANRMEAGRLNPGQKLVLPR
jgi:LysM repeat protein